MKISIYFDFVTHKFLHMHKKENRKEILRVEFSKDLLNLFDVSALNLA